MLRECLNLNGVMNVMNVHKLCMSNIRMQFWRKLHLKCSHLCLYVATWFVSGIYRIPRMVGLIIY